MRITHSVYSGNLGCAIDLQYLTEHSCHVIFSKTPFKCVKLRSRFYKGTMMIYESGRVFFHGDSMKIFRKFARMVWKIGFPVVISDFKLLTRSATHRLGEQVNYKVLKEHFTNSSLEEELFHGLHLRVQNMSFTVFASSGAVNVVGIRGSRDEDQARAVLLEMEFVLYDFNRQKNQE